MFLFLRKINFCFWGMVVDFGLGGGWGIIFSRLFLIGGEMILLFVIGLVVV